MWPAAAAVMTTAVVTIPATTNIHTCTILVACPPALPSRMHLPPSLRLQAGSECLQQGAHRTCSTARHSMGQHSTAWDTDASMGHYETRECGGVNPAADRWETYLKKNYLSDQGGGALLPLTGASSLLI
jgi:hypothetical protein